MRESKERMDVTIYENSQEDLKKIAFLLIVVVISFCVDIRDDNSIYAAIFVQGVSNIETFWDIRKNQFINSLTRKLVTFILCTSFITLLLIMVNWCNGVSWMSCIGVKVILLIIVLFPLVFWFRDYKLNAEKENK